MMTRLTLRWWHWPLVAVGVVLVMTLTVLWSLRSIGRGEYQTVMDALQAQGRAATIDDYLAHLPAVDVATQAAWKRWSDLRLDFPDSTHRGMTPAQWQAYILGAAEVPAEFRADLEAARPQVDTARTLLRTHRLVLSVKGWAAQELPKARRTPLDFSGLTIPNLLTTRSLALWLRHESCLAADPAPVLDDLDAYQRALSQPGCLIDAMIQIVIAGLRDETYLDLALLGRLPEAHRERWLAEPCDLLAGVGDGFDGERTLFLGSWTEWIEHMDLLQSFRGGRVVSDLSAGLSGGSPAWWDLEWLYSGPLLWCTAHHDMAILTEAEAAMGARFRGAATRMPDAAATTARMWGYGSVSLPDLVQSGITALDADARHRMARIAVRLLARASAGGLPQDQDDLARVLGGTRLLSPPGDHLHLAYERLAPERFRLVVAPTSPVPDFDDPAQLATRSRAFGTPASDKPMVTRPHLELPIPKALRQPAP